MAIGSYITQTPLILPPAPMFWASARQVNNFGVAQPSADAAIAAWKDLKPYQSNATQATGAQQPIFKTNIVNGLPGLRFTNGSDTNLTMATTPLNDLFATGGLCLFVVTPLTTGQSSIGRLFSQGGGNAYLDLNSGSGSTAKMQLTKGFSTTAGAWSTSGSVVNLGATNIVTVDYDASSVSNDPVLYVNSTSGVSITETSTPAGTQSASTTYTIGNSGILNRDFDGYIHEIIFIKKTLEASNIQSLIRNFANIYGVALS